MKIAVLGTGRIGAALGKKWGAAGHTVFYGSRDPGSEKARNLVAETSPDASAAAPGDAIRAGEAVLFATPWAAVAGIAGEHAADLDGKLLIDATNRFFTAGPINNLAALVSAAPNGWIYRAFNSLGYEVFEDPVYDGIQADMFFSGPEGTGRETMAQLIREIGVRPIWVGENDRIELVDNMGALWVTLIFKLGHPRDYMFKLVRRSNQPANQPTSEPTS